MPRAREHAEASGNDLRRSDRRRLWTGRLSHLPDGSGLKRVTESAAARLPIERISTGRHALVTGEHQHARKNAKWRRNLSLTMVLVIVPP